MPRKKGAGKVGKVLIKSDLPELNKEITRTPFRVISPFVLNQFHLSLGRK